MSLTPILNFKFLRTFNHNKISVITRDKNQLPEGIISRISSVVLEPGLTDKNNIFCDEKTIETIVNDPSIQEKIKDRNLYGRFGWEGAFYMAPDITHVVSKLELKNGSLYSELDILDVIGGRDVDLCFQDHSCDFYSFIDLKIEEVKSFLLDEKEYFLINSEVYEFETINIYRKQHFCDMSELIN